MARAGAYEEAPPRAMFSTSHGRRTAHALRIHLHPPRFGFRALPSRPHSDPRECDFELVAVRDAAMLGRTVAELTELWPRLDLAQRMAGKSVEVGSLSPVGHLHDPICVFKRRGYRIIPRPKAVVRPDWVGSCLG